MSPSRHLISFKRYHHTIGFVGLGNMGLPMLTNLWSKSIAPARKDTKIIIYDTDKVAMDTALKLGHIVTQAQSLAQLALSRPQFIITVLPSCNASIQVISELIHHSTSVSNPTPCVFIDCSTIAIASSLQNHHKVSETTTHVYLDAPISGGVKGAREGTLTFMIGTNSQVALDQVRPILLHMGKTIHHCGGPGSGTVAKICNNLALATQMIGICEAMNLGTKLGIDPLTLTNVLNSSTAACWSSRMNNPHPHVAMELGSGAAANEYTGGFESKLMMKDLGLAIQASNDAGVALPLVSSHGFPYTVHDCLMI
jgi:3-hydroxyisobutyrate dehydrogenase